MTFKRWLPTFLAFPIGGYVTIQTVGSADSPLKAALGGLLAGAIIGAGQWLALRPSRKWIAYTAGAMAAGSAVASVVTGSGTEAADVMVTGLITGAAIGAAQSTLLPQGRAAWTAITATGWSFGWLATWLTIVDIERGYSVFGASGALLVTLATGLALRAKVLA
jgi:hypothetical protein